VPSKKGGILAASEYLAAEGARREAAKRAA
jgi:hypothetical protein